MTVNNPETTTTNVTAAVNHSESTDAVQEKQHASCLSMKDYTCQWGKCYGCAFGVHSFPFVAVTFINYILLTCSNYTYKLICQCNGSPTCSWVSLTCPFHFGFMVCAFTDPTVRFMLEQIQKLGCNIDVERHIKCVPCKARVGEEHAIAGGFHPEEGVCARDRFWILKTSSYHI